MADLPDSFFFDPLPEEELRPWEGDEDEDDLVDTHAFFWWLTLDRKLSPSALKLSRTTATRCWSVR